MEEAEIRKLLKAEIVKTEKKVAQYGELCRPISPDNAIGRVSRMDAINNKGVMEAALRKSRERLDGLRRNLGKLGTQEFGICPKCKKTIAIQRVLLAPQSSFCVNCAP
jgi:DnaK suppressor protein